LNYDNCHCSSEELDRQLKIIRNKRELETLEREKKERIFKASQPRERGPVGGIVGGALLGNRSGVIPPSAAAYIAKLFG